VQVLVTLVLQLLPHTGVLPQHVPVWPAPTAMPPDEHTSPPVHAQVRPVVSPGKRGNAGAFDVLHGAPAAPVALYVPHVLYGTHVPGPVVELQ
jgi:hypothetical protein